MKKLTTIFIAGCLLLLLPVGQALAGTPESGASYQNNRYNIVDPASGLTWSAYTDNPTSIYRYQMNASGSTRRLPSIEELTALFSKLSTVLQNNPNSAAGRNLTWLTENGSYPSSTLITTVEQKTLYKGISWNNNTRQFEEVLLGGGDLVVITEVSK